ncbi:hypothetical protein JJL45_02030 [Tamlana sp. s12]|uniref:hypothetical protein n=1 Tax=Tamlana sp. s12 TaxID=1630406 RepID=UPI0007FE7BDB|nr:hypothetical protein [Tamlana sp. s12]OBQ57028.1 hypothetical protein VQ01_00645 [Tamlana sp. s12]QQY82796.1 hypothetical protein JJL45_02030 [Tamlana sp. s12]
MLKKCTFLLLLLFCSTFVEAQSFTEQPQKTSKDTLKKHLLLKSIGTGYFPTKYFNFDLRYLIKFNQFEGIRTGIGGVTNDKFSEKYRLNSYGVYGFRDHRFKFSIGGGMRLIKKSNTWLNFAYTDDLQETGSTKYITDNRVFQFFEPRLLNIDLFYKYISKSLTFEHQISNHLLSKVEFAVSDIDPTYDYAYALDDQLYTTYNLSTAIIGFQWSPFSKFKETPLGTQEVKSGFPKFSFQYTKSYHDVFKGDFDFTKLDFRTIFELGQENSHFAQIIFVSGMAIGDTPLTHLYHAYPNNIRKEKILERFSIAGLNSFETMYFNEFFSDKFFTFQLKYFIKPFHVTERFRPQVVLITRYALGDMDNIDRHQDVTFDTLNYGYTESGFEINKLLYGFGLSFTYRYGAYYLPTFSDNIAFKFTFNVSL